MTPSAVIQLIHSLSKAEKRQFKVNSNRQNGKKDYVRLFDLIDKEQVLDKVQLVAKLQEAHPEMSLENTSRYLFNEIMDTLVSAGIKRSATDLLIYRIIVVNILNERNLTNEAYKELMRLKEIAKDLQQPVIAYILSRMELKYHLDNNFKDLGENELIDLQSFARHSVKQILHTHEHFSLYEVLKLRMISSGFMPSRESELNDLLLNEMAIVNSRIKHNLESKKLHLLFQSFYFSNIGDYKSALKTSTELNKLFEQNELMLKNPPLDYFISLDGILDNLSSNLLYSQMGYYLKKLREIDGDALPEHFSFLIKKTELKYKLIIHLGNKDYAAAVSEIKSSNPSIWNQYKLIDEEIQNELLFYIALSHYHLGKAKTAQKYVNEITLIGKVNQKLITYKAARLLSIIMSYENRDMEFLDYEIRSYKRAISNGGKLMKTEKMMFKVIRINPQFNSAAKNDFHWKAIGRSVMAIEVDRYEKKILKYYNFMEWIRSKFDARDGVV